MERYEKKENKEAPKARLIGLRLIIEEYSSGVRCSDRLEVWRTSLDPFNRVGRRKESRTMDAEMNSELKNAGLGDFMKTYTAFTGDVTILVICAKNDFSVGGSSIFRVLSAFMALCYQNTRQ